MTAFAIIEGSILMVLAAALSIHVIYWFLDVMADWFGRCADRDQAAPLLRALPDVVSELVDDDESPECDPLVTVCAKVANRPWNSPLVRSLVPHWQAATAKPEPATDTTSRPRERKAKPKRRRTRN